MTMPRHACLAPHDSERKRMEYPGLLKTIDELREKAIHKERYLIGVAGPPGAGKSTFAEELRLQFKPDSATVIPMDGFHYDNIILKQRGLLARKGAPETFDYRGFEILLRRIRDGEQEIAYPVFDREADLARAGAGIVDREVKFIIVEGNYLLLDEDPWSKLADLFDFSIFIDVPKAELKERLEERWRTHGLSPHDAIVRANTNDMPNADRVLAARKSPDLFLSCSASGERGFRAGQHS